MDFSQWKLFRIGNIFKCSTTTALKTSEVVEGDVIYITRSAINNGCSGFVADNDDKLELGNCITIGAEGAVAFYQKEDFLPGVKIYTLRCENLNESNGLFVATIINKSCYKYSYNRARISSIIENEEILLPEKDGSPDWDYMTNYVENLKDKVDMELNALITLSQGDEETLKSFSGEIDFDDFSAWAKVDNNQLSALNTSIWKEYRIGDLFDTFTGGDLILGDVEEGEIPIVTHSATNNSVAAFSSVIPGRPLFDHRNTIALADRGTFYATIQNEDFYIGTRVKALKSKYDKISKHMLLFIATIINNESYRFSYGRMFRWNFI